MAEESREELIRKALLANALSAQSKAIDTNVNIAPPVPTDEVVAPKRTVNIRGSEIDLDKDYLREHSNFSIASGMGSEGMDLVGAKVDIPDEYPLYSKDGAQVPIPKPVQFVLETLASLGVNVAGLGIAGTAGLVGLMGDLLVSAFGMKQSEAERLARDVMAAPEAFAGKLGTLPLTKIERGAIPKIPEVKDTDKKPVEPTVKPVETPEMTADQIGELVSKASSRGLGSEKAINELIAQAKINPEAYKAAQRLNIKLPPDVFSDSPLVKEAAGLTRSIAGSDVSANWRRTIEDAQKKADEVMASVGGDPDISTISFDIKTRFEDTRDALKNAQKPLYDFVDGNAKKGIVAAVNPTAPASTENIVSYLTEKARKLGGVINLSSENKNLLNELSRKNPMTYFRLTDIKKKIVQAQSKQTGPFADIDDFELNELMDALREDQLVSAKNIGGTEAFEKLKAANATTVKVKELEKLFVKGFGRQLSGDISPLLKNIIKKGKEGNVEPLNKAIEIVPEDLQKDAILSALTNIATDRNGNFDFAKFRASYQGLKTNKAIRKILIQKVGTETISVLDDLNDISIRITEARGNVLTTGKANQALVNSMLAQGIVDKFMQSPTGKRVVQGAATGGGATLGGPYGAMAALGATELLPKGVDRLKAIGDLFQGEKFKNLIDNVVETGAMSSKAINELANSPSYKRWAKTMGIEDPRNWLNTTIVGTADTDAIPVEPEGIPTEPEELTQSSALQSIIEQTDPETRDRILQQV